jgi:hypothetical protein
MDADNAITVSKHTNMLTSITEFKASGAFYGDQSANSRSKSRASGTEEDYSQSSSNVLEENTFTIKMTDASAQERKLLKKLEQSLRENDNLMQLIKQSDTQL